MAVTGVRAEGARGLAARTLRAAGGALAELVGGVGTAAPAFALLLLLAVTVVTAPLGVGLLLAPLALRALHALAGRERARLARRGPEVVAPQSPPVRLRLALADTTTLRELRWLLRHGTLGLLLGLVGLWLPLSAVRDTTFPLYWRFAPQGLTATSFGYGVAHSWADACAVSMSGVGSLAVLLGLSPAMARLQAAPGRRLLAAGPDQDLSLRVAELTATRAAALDAHATELRRIERALHDGTQNRLVSVTVLLGAARRQVARDPSRADEILERAQSAAEQALAELRTVARGILPPVLDDRGLAGALSGLAAESPVPCRLDVDVPARCAASVEATAYFVVAEALTNVARHSGAERAEVTVRARDGRLTLTIKDDGHGGADDTPRARAPQAAARADEPSATAEGDGASGTAKPGTHSGTAEVGPVSDTGEPVELSGTGKTDDPSGAGRPRVGGSGMPGEASGTGKPGAHSGTAEVGPVSGTAGPVGVSGAGKANGASGSGRPGVGGSGMLGGGSGTGGAGGGSGLVGIRRRVAAHDGTFRLTSPVGGPTCLEVELPCGT